MLAHRLVGLCKHREVFGVSKHNVGFEQVPMQRQKQQLKTIQGIAREDMTLWDLLVEGVYASTYTTVGISPFPRREVKSIAK